MVVMKQVIIDASRVCNTSYVSDMDLERVSQDLLTKEFLAVVFAGYGDG